MTEKELIQNNIYIQLTNENIQPISSRFVAMELQELGCKKIDKIEKIDELKYSLTFNNNKYIVSLHQLDLADAEIEKV